MFQDAEWNLWEEADPVGTGLLEEDGLDDEPLPDGDGSEVVEMRARSTTMRSVRSACGVMVGGGRPMTKTT
jgi:hypothetical protein